MTKPTYYAPHGGHPGQEQMLTSQSIFTEAYAFLPASTMRDIVTSFLPFWDKTRLWVIARPMTGFAETFSQYIMEVQPGGGSQRPELDPMAQGVLFVVEGEITVRFRGETYVLGQGGYAYLPAGMDWTLENAGKDTARLLPASMLCGWSGSIQVLTLQGCEPSRKARAVIAPPKRRCVRMYSPNAGLPCVRISCYCSAVALYGSCDVTTIDPTAPTTAQSSILH